jgi:hypothetical protein
MVSPTCLARKQECRVIQQTMCSNTVCRTVQQQQCQEREVEDCTAEEEEEECRVVNKTVCETVDEEECDDVLERVCREMDEDSADEDTLAREEECSCVCEEGEDCKLLLNIEMSCAVVTDKKCNNITENV